jgi:chemotaxis family two-component system response regulator Rcp1
MYRILVVEDSKADFFLIREAISAAGVNATLRVVTDGEQALQFLRNASDGGESCPDLILLDLNIPKKDGTEVLRQLRGNGVCKDALVLVVTSSDSMRDRESVNALGISGYFRKPSVFVEFMELGAIVKSLLSVSKDSPDTPHCE